MAGKGAKPGERRGGRQKGTPNKTTVEARNAWQYAFDTIGGADALADWGRENRTEFYKLFARTIPVDVQHGGTIAHEHRQQITLGDRTIVF